MKWEFFQLYCSDFYALRGTETEDGDYCMNSENRVYFDGTHKAFKLGPCEREKCPRRKEVDA